MSSYWNNGKFCHNVADIPTSNVHWAIVYDESVHIPGDERSRTHPGHGYPERTHSYTVYVAFESEEDWKKQIAALESQSPRRTQYRAFRVQPVSVKVNIDVVIG